MSDTKERILLTALELFSKEGYKAVSVSSISQKLGMTKSVLYKHYKGKREIFENIVSRMQQADFDNAAKNDVPTGTVDEMSEAYKKTSVEEIKQYTKEMFSYWTENSFAASFRKMLSLERYRDSEMAELYRQYLSLGPLKYIEDLFVSISKEGEQSHWLALEFYAPIYFLYDYYDAEPVGAKSALNEHLKCFFDRLLLNKR